MLKLKVAILAVLLGSACTALPMTHLEKREAAQKVSKLKACLAKNSQLESLKELIMYDHEDIYKDGGVTKASGYIPYPTNGGEPFDTSICFADPQAEKDLTKTGVVLVGDGTVDIGDGYERNRNTRNYCPIPSILAQPGSPKALCKFTNMNVQARIKLVPLQFKNCAFKECKTIKTKAATTTTEVKGEIKFAAEIFEVFNLEASLSAGLTNSYTFTTTEEQASAKGDTAFEIGVTVEIATKVDSISIAGMERGYNSVGPCTEDLFTTKAPVNNTYILKSASRNIWINCDEDKKPATPATPATPAAAKRQENQVGAAPADAGTGGTAPGSADTASAAPTTEEELTDEDIFGSLEEANSYCLSFAEGIFAPEECV
ncbi:hypothetical protein BGW39_009045 [Mortierella sp. 14UC]|nr:hypothetical protein BGW39_009045 [Mortierella sp. 14UC]